MSPAEEYRQEGGQQQAEWRKEVAEAEKQGVADKKGDLPGHGQGFEQRALSAYPAQGGDETADPGIGGANQGAPCLHGAQDRHGKGMVWRTGASVPGVVGQIDQQVGAGGHAFPGQVGKDLFITN